MVGWSGNDLIVAHLAGSRVCEMPRRTLQAIRVLPAVIFNDAMSKPESDGAAIVTQKFVQHLKHARVRPLVEQVCKVAGWTHQDVLQ
jgi:hypothetical protein